MDLKTKGQVRTLHCYWVVETSSVINTLKAIQYTNIPESHRTKDTVWPVSIVIGRRVNNGCMSIMIFNVNIYRTWKKNRILKIKWNKYNIIQFPQCLCEEIIMEIFLNSASPVRQRACRPPQRNPYSSPTCSSPSIYIDSVFKLQVWMSPPHRFFLDCSFF